MFVAHLRSRRALVWGGVLAALGIALCFVPLFDALGFEFAFAIGLLAGFAASDLAAALVRRVRQGGAFSASARPPAVVARLFAVNAGATLALLVPPLVAIVLNAARVRQCDWGTGFLFYAALPGATALLGTAAGLVAGLAFASRPIVGAFAAWLIPLGSIALGLWRFYAAPPIFGYDPFAGYFPGTLYDEDVALGGAFVWSRLYQGAFALAALAACAATLDPATLGLRRTALFRPGPSGEPSGRFASLVVGLVAAGTAATLSVRSAELGFAVDADDIARALGGRRETPHFVIIYPRGAPFEPFMDAIAAEHEFRYAQLARVFGIEPAGKITSFYFTTAEEKRRWMGAGGTYIAKPWRREIYIQHEDFPHDTLRHEVAHVFAGEFGDPVFRVSVAWWAWPPARFNVGLIEGIAVAADWPGAGIGRPTPHEAARAMKELGLLPPLRALLAPGFLQFSSAQSYTTAGSFVYFLLERYGPEKVRAVYRAGGTPASFQAVFGVPLRELERKWHEAVGKTPLAPEDLEIARERYRRRGIFHRPCPHAVARRMAEAAAASPEEAVRILRRVCVDDPGEPGHKILLAAALERAERPDEALAVYLALADDVDGVSAPLRARALLFAADLAARRGDLATANAAILRALPLGVDETTRRNLLIRREAYGGDGPGPAALRAYLLARGPAGEPDPFVQLLRAEDVATAMPDTGLGHYLVGRVLSQRGAFTDAARAHARAEALGLAEPLVRRENARLWARATFLAGDLDAAEAGARVLADAAQPPAVQLEGRDWLERCAFARTGALPLPAVTGR